MLINYTGKNLFYFKDFRFVPKANVVPDSLWSEMKENPVIKDKIKKGLFVEDKAVKSDADLTHSLSDLSLKDAKEIVSNTLDIVQLEKWQKTETRKGLMPVLEEQILKVTEHLKAS